MGIETVLESLMGYGALGAVCVYLAIKDWKLTEKVTQALDNVTSALTRLDTSIKILEKEVEG